MESFAKLAKFVTAQDVVYDVVCGELIAGRKKMHWIWYIFPQLASLGFSPLARRYGLASLTISRLQAVEQ